MGTVRGMHTNVHSNGSVYTRGTLRGSFLFFSCPRLKAGVRRSEEVGTSSSCVGWERWRIREVGARAGEGVFVSVKSDALPEAHYNGEQRVSAPLKNNSSNSHVVTDCFADEKHMMHALSVARTAFSLGEVPVGAVAVHSATGTVVATAHNETESLQVCLSESVFYLLAESPIDRAYREGALTSDKMVSVHTFPCILT